MIAYKYHNMQQRREGKAMSEVEVTPGERAAGVVTRWTECKAGHRISFTVTGGEEPSVMARHFVKDCPYCEELNIVLRGALVEVYLAQLARGGWVQ